MNMYFNVFFPTSYFHGIFSSVLASINFLEKVFIYNVNHGPNCFKLTPRNGKMICCKYMWAYIVGCGLEIAGKLKEN